MGITHKVVFDKTSEDTHAFFSLNADKYYIFLNINDLRKRDLSAIIHEINEIEISHLLARIFKYWEQKPSCQRCIRNRLINGIIHLNGEPRFLTHLLSPYGKGSFLGYSEKKGYERVEW